MELDPRKPRLAFVGAFTRGDDGLVGGTYTACRQLMDSPLGELFELHPIDISQPTLRSRRFANRMLAGAFRTLRVLSLVVARRIDAALIFATLGPSWLERGLMAIICRAGGIPVYI